MLTQQYFTHRRLQKLEAYHMKGLKVWLQEETTITIHNNKIFSRKVKFHF